MTKLSNRDRDQVVQVYMRGETVAVIAECFGISESHVFRIVRDAGAPRRIGSGIPQRDVPPGYRRLASGKVIRYTPPR